MASETEILQSLIAAASAPPGAPGWADLLRLLAETTRAGTVALRLEQAGRPVAAWHHGAPPPALEETDKMRLGRVYAQGDLPGLMTRRAPLRALRAPAGPGGTALLWLSRPEGSEDFRAIDGALLSALAPYMGPALQGWDSREEDRRRAARDAALLRDLGAGWILFSAGATVLDLSPGLGALLETQAGLRIAADGRISFRDSANAQALHQAMAQALSDGPSGQAVLLCLAEEPRLELLITAEYTEGERRLLGRLRQARRARALPLAAFERHLGLPPAEARLAACLCDGLTLAETAEELGWTIETARSTSKRVFARLGARKQQEVVRRMQAGALWFHAPGEGEGTALREPDCMYW